MAETRRGKRLPHEFYMQSSGRATVSVPQWKKPRVAFQLLEIATTIPTFGRSCLLPPLSVSLSPSTLDSLFIAMAIMLVSHLHISLLLNTFEKEHGTEIERDRNGEREMEMERERGGGEK